MTSFTFPLARSIFADKLRLTGLKLRLDKMDDFAFTGGGAIYATEMSPPIWTGEGQVGILTPRQAAELQALFEVLDGSMNSFYMTHVLYQFPFSDPNGEVLSLHATPIKIGSISGDGTQITIKDAPPGFEFTAGSFFHFDFGSSPVHRAFHRLVTTVTANGLGITPLVEVRPRIRPGAAVNTVLEFKRPCFEAKIVPQSFSEGAGETLIVTGMGLQFRQVI